MPDPTLASVVGEFAQLTASLPDAALERSWAWRDYTGEGVRFAFFRTYEELRALAVHLLAVRAASDAPRTAAQHILGQYHAAYRDLGAVLLGVDEDLYDRPPAESEWSARRTLAHIVGGDIGFRVACTYALAEHRRGNARPGKASDDEWDAISGLEEAEYRALLTGPLDELTAYHATLHTRILEEFSGMRDAELELPSMFWEDAPYPLRFRLHRFDAHMRQHTIQIEKTLAALGQQPAEARRLLRRVYGALAEAENALIGAPEVGASLRQAAADSIRARAAEIEAAVA